MNYYAREMIFLWGNKKKFGKGVPNWRVIALL